ncbi:MAG: NAD(+)/NADH kinase [Candidatus Rokubacteria bacterium]|nr:NAD(+)/NADH kinase [Candidatus Rokubacteria bacterium]
MKRVGIVAKPGAAEARDVIPRLLEWLGGRGLTPVLEKETAALVPAASVASVGKPELPAQVDLVVVLGGDGTLLSMARAVGDLGVPTLLSMARAVGDLGVPLLGVNLGGLGFLTATTLDEMLPALEALLAGRMAADERMMLTTRVVRNGQRLGEYAALNDVVITKAAMSRIIDLAVSVEGQHATEYRADGLIISTPTGSTAYSLSAGGPILFPTMDAIVLTPICSHTLTNRPIVLPGMHRVEVTLLADQEVMVTVDGQVGVNLKQGDTVEVVKAAARIRLIRFPQKDFFSVLRTKLMWGAR